MRQFTFNNVSSKFPLVYEREVGNMLTITHEMVLSLFDTIIEQTKPKPIAAQSACDCAGNPIGGTE